MKTLFALLAALLLGACATRFEKPSVSLAGVDVESLGLFEQRYVLQLRVRNPNDTDIPIDGLSFDIELNGMHFATGISNSAVRVPRLGEALVDVSATSNLASFFRQLRELEGGGRSGLDYRIKGSLSVAGYGALPFDQRGEVPFPDFAGWGGAGKKPPGPERLPGSI